jgi:transposase
MRVSEREPGDVAELRRLAGVEKNALRRERYRSVLLALEGKEAEQIAEAVGRSRRAVQDWVYAYRDGGLGNIQPLKRKGANPKLPRHLEEAVKARLDAGPRPEDGVCTLRGKNIVEILEKEFGVKHTLGSIYGVLERIGYSCLTPRPRHEKADPEAVEAFKQQAPLLSVR